MCVYICNKFYSKTITQRITAPRMNFALAKSSVEARRRWSQKARGSSTPWFGFAIRGSVVPIIVRMDPRIVSTRPCPSWKRPYVESVIGRHASRPFLTISGDSQRHTVCRPHTSVEPPSLGPQSDNYFPIIINSTTTSTRGATIITGISSTGGRVKKESVHHDGTRACKVVLRIARCVDSFYVGLAFLR